MRLWATYGGAMFDLWTVAHVCLPLSISMYVTTGLKCGLWTITLIALGIGIGWEIVECLWEGSALHRPDLGPGEVWYGRWFGDLLADWTGAAIGWRIATAWMEHHGG